MRCRLIAAADCGAPSGRVVFAHVGRLGRASLDLGAHGVVPFRYAADGRGNSPTNLSGRDIPEAETMSRTAGRTNGAPR